MGFYKRLMSKIDENLKATIDPTVEWKEEILVLAGDIGDPFSPFYSKFLKLCSSSFGNVVLVAGNHEYYNSQPMSFVIDKIKRIVEKLDNVYFLNVDSPNLAPIKVIINNTIFIGTTLWSTGSDRSSIYDLTVINGMSRLRYNQLHLLHLDRLEKEIAKSVSENLNIVVVTHHLPCKELISSEYANDNEELNKFYYSDCSKAIKLLVSEN